MADPMRQDAVIRNLEIVGEAAKTQERRKDKAFRSRLQETIAEDRTILDRLAR